MDKGKQSHWDTVYTTKTPQQVSWTQDKPEASLNLVRSFTLDKSAPVIDIGGGDSKFVDHMLDAGYSDITVLDISGPALKRAQERLGTKAAQVKWITADITTFQPDRFYELWHDRAAFHFLTQQEDINYYRNIVSIHVSRYLILGTFSEHGPEQCSNLPVQRYNAEQINQLFKENFRQLHHHTEAHRTPFGTSQDFLFTSYEKISHH